MHLHSGILKTDELEKKDVYIKSRRRRFMKDRENILEKD